MARRTTRALLWLALVASLAAAVTSPAVGQGEPILLDTVEELDFDRPESWAMKYFTSLSLLTGLGTPVAIEPGKVVLGLEGGLVPSLGEEKRRVGFIGSKVEDLNRTNVFGRLRATIGLPHEFSVTLGVTPPVELGGVTPKLFSVALARPLHEAPKWRLGLRLLAQTGTIEGDLSCPADIVGLDDPVLNPDGCLEPSSDEVTQNYLGLEVSVSPRLGGGKWEPHFSLIASHLDLEFQVRARYSVFDDRSRLLTDGFEWAATAGAGYRFNERLRGSGEVFYSPLSVVRETARGAQTDELFNVRVLVAYALR